MSIEEERPARFKKMGEIVTPEFDILNPDRWQIYGCVEEFQQRVGEGVKRMREGMISRIEHEIEEIEASSDQEFHEDPLVSEDEFLTRKRKEKEDEIEKIRKMKFYITLPGYVFIAHRKKGSLQVRDEYQNEYEDLILSRYDIIKG